MDLQYLPGDLAQVQSEDEKQRRRMQQAQQLMQAGYNPVQGGNANLALLASIMSTIRGNADFKDAEGKLSENLRKRFEIENASKRQEMEAARSAREADREFELRKIDYKADAEARNRPPEKVGWEERLFNSLPENMRGQAALNKFGLGPKAGPAPSEASRKADLLRSLGATDEQIRDSMLGGKGRTGPAQMPASALKLQQEEISTLQSASNLGAAVEDLTNRIDSGELDLGPVANIVNKARNSIGMSTGESRNLATMQATLEKMRNDSLRLNKGVQTEGDAQRAWNELLANLNDPKVVRQRLQEIKTINDAAIQQRMFNIDTIRSNFGAEPLDMTGVTGRGALAAPKGIARPAGVPDQGTPIGQIITGPDGRKYRITGGDPNDPDVEPVG